MVRAHHRLHHGQIRHEPVRAGPGGELKSAGVAVNALWPRTTIATAAVRNLWAATMMRQSRTPDIMADAAYAILTKGSRSPAPVTSTSTTRCCTRAACATSSLTASIRTVPLMSDFFVPDDDVPPPGVTVMALPSVGEVQKAR